MNIIENLFEIIENKVFLTDFNDTLSFKNLYWAAV